MNAPTIIMRLIWVASLLTGSCFGPRLHAQQSGPAPSAEQEFMDAIKKRSTVYDSIAAHDVRVRVYHGLALATGRADQRVRSAKGTSKVTVRFTEIYVRREGRWLLSAWEAKKVASANPGRSPI